ncbi:putative TPR domain protein [Tolypothrix sp. NIES-4075]|uniref:tetratricopeptide repeat protein n=1 Tax=Tolypothrix sp. NIES-4075 TaxID=2005459 RepID=UPI000B5C961A|nr:tetratricopeptide repeat protein [Tolypothrix sp. NIES-4075]GAX40934.1 putative TPR domain protein [Tolypothrix sp. NIES-4075]
MSTIDDVKAENQRNYQKLIVALEASQGILNLLIAVCDDRNLREILINQYETELRQQDFLTYRVRVRTQDPSLRYALAQLVAKENLQPDKSAVITVLGLDELLSVKLDNPKSDQDKFFGYLQWTREGLREFLFPIVLWLNEPMLVSLAQRSPDFWSWRGGVFWFTRESTSIKTENISSSQHTLLKSVPKEIGGLPLEEILRLISQIEAEGKEAPLLATLYDSLASSYQQRDRSSQDRKLAIQAYEKAIALQKKLELKADLASSLENLGNLYFELRDDVTQAEDCYQQALELYRDIGDRLGEANTLQAIGDVLQFLKRSDEALSRYESALQFYREIGDRLGEANTLQAIGDVLQFLKRSDEALSRYESALQFYRDIGARLGEANTLKAIGDVLQFLKRSDEALSRYESALQFYREIGDRLGEANILQEFGKLQDNPQQALLYLQQAQNLYMQIAHIYSQSLNLLFIADAQLNMGESNAAINSLNEAATLAAEINYTPLQEYAQARIAQINTPSSLSVGIKERFINFTQKRWVQFAFCFLVGLIAFLLLRR